MQRLVIPVEDNIAQTWEKAAPAQRAQIIRLFSWLLERDDWQACTPQGFAQLLDQISDKATANGLTPEILAEIMDEN
ncbi:MAG: hypothetical protein ABIO24_01375 [Saprospiraceae bacterium]